MAERNKEIDILRGIGIFLVVFNHTGWGAYFHTYIQAFHMPLFFILSGYFSKNRSLKETAAKRAKALLIPYIIFECIYLPVALFTSLPEEKLTLLSSLKAIFLFPTDSLHLPIASALWFLPCMFIAGVVYNDLGRFSLKTKTVIILIVSAAGAVYSGLSDYMLPLTLEPAAAALLFMLAGEWIKEKKINETVSSKWYLIAGLLITEAALAFLNKSVDMRSARFHIVPLFFLNGIMGTLAYWGISAYIAKFRTRPGGIIRDELATAGRYSIAILCTHQVFILILKKCFADFLDRGLVYEAAFKALILIVTILICRLIIEACRHWKPVRFIFGLS